MDVDDPGTPVSYEDCDSVPGPFFHGTRAALAPGAELVAGRTSNFHAGRVMNHLYFTSLLEIAAFAAEIAVALAGAEDPGHVYVVEPTGPFEDDPNVTDKKFPGNPTRSYRTRDPVRVVAEVEDWPRLPPQEMQARLDGLARLRAEGRDVIED